MVKVMRKNKKLIIIVPCYNEEETLEYTTKELTKKQKIQLMQVVFQEIAEFVL